MQFKLLSNEATNVTATGSDSIPIRQQEQEQHLERLTLEAANLLPQLNDCRVEWRDWLSVVKQLKTHTQN